MLTSQLTDPYQNVARTYRQEDFRSLALVRADGHDKVSRLRRGKEGRALVGESIRGVEGAKAA
jgi:hypothetical protein